VVAFFFDRLCSPGENQGRNLEERKKMLFRSITKEIERITSQRQYFSGFSASQSGEVYKRSVLGFGIKRSIGSTRTVSQNDLVKKEIRSAIISFEPRLLRPQVEFISPDGSSSQMRFSVTGFVALDLELTRYEATFLNSGEQ